MTATRGLEGVVATQSSISSIIDDTLTYVGYNIDDLTENACFEEVIYLLWHRELPTSEQLKELKEQLSAEMELPQAVIDNMKSYPLDVHPMAILRTAVSTLGLYDKNAETQDKNEIYKKAVSIQAKIATIVTAFSRIRKGLEPVAPRKDLGFAENFMYMLKGEEADAIEVEAMDKALILHADHELNASTFTARVCVATLSDVYSGLSAAIGALKGPLHGGANEQVMKMLTEIGSVDKAEEYIMNKLNNKELIMGFGHRVYRKGDPRAKHLQEMSKKLTTITGQPQWYDISVKVEEVFTSQKPLPPNVDFYSASVYHSLGIDHDLFTPIFAVSRTSGWLAHIMEQYDNNRLIRPRAEYTGPGMRKYKPIEERTY